MHDPIAIHKLCTGKQRHPSKAAARMELEEKARLTGRRHKVAGCPLCIGFHVHPVQPAKVRRARRQAAFA